VTFGVRDGAELVVLLQSNSSRQALRFEEPAGLRVALNISAIGKALLAFHLPTRATVRTATPLRRATNRSLMTEKALLADLLLSHERGYALLDEERVEGVRSTGAAGPAGPRDPRVGVSIQGPTIRFGDARVEELAATARALAARLPPLLPPSLR
jgi:IclR family acetate operon transcriptional repressor